MTQFVLMARHSGALLIGTRITFLDKWAPQFTLHETGPLSQYRVVLAEAHGWIVENPEMSGVPIFFNLEGVSKFFEVLGVL